MKTSDVMMQRLFLRQLHRITKVFRSKTAQQLLFDWVKNSALYAPSAMESSVHQMLVSYASGSGVVESAELMRHASQVTRARSHYL